MGIQRPTRRAQVVQSRTTRLLVDRVVTGFAMTITTHTPANAWSGPIVVLVSTKAAVPPRQLTVYAHNVLHCATATPI